jgi:hypothetical protein
MLRWRCSREPGRAGHADRRAAAQGAEDGDGSEVFCRQTELVLRQNAGMVPPDFELAELQQDIATLDALRPRLQRLRTLTDRADDTELALGSDILSASLDGYALTKVIGQGTGLDTLKAAMKTRLPASRANPPIPPPERPPTAAPQGGRAVHVGGLARPGKPPATTSFATKPTPFRAGRVQTPQHHIWAGRPFPPGLSGYAALTRPTFRRHLRQSPPSSAPGRKPARPAARPTHLAVSPGRRPRRLSRPPTQPALPEAQPMPPLPGRPCRRSCGAASAGYAPCREALASTKMMLQPIPATGRAYISYRTALSNGQAPPVSLIGLHCPADRPALSLR